MKRLASIIGMVIIFLGIVFSLAFAQETLTISTYYPSPYGSYGELRSQNVAIGANYTDVAQYCWAGTCTNTIDPNANLVVEGRVGIGTTSPTQELEIVATEAGVKLKSTGTGANDGPAVIFYNNNVLAAAQIALYSSTYTAPFGNAFGLVNIANNASIVFSTNVSGAVAPRMVISNGNVGIGTTTPGVRLEVNGAVKMGTDASACGASNAGAIRYQSPNMQFCNGTAWTNM